MRSPVATAECEGGGQEQSKRRQADGEMPF
jgi:hypothetical protein